MTARRAQSRPPSAPAGGTSNPGPGLVCQTCEHLDVLHDISKATKRRTACSVSSGPTATPCGCRAFVAAAEPLT